MAPRFAFLSQGKLYLKSGDSPESLHDSPFVRGVRDRALELLRRHSWKSGGSAERMIPRAALWGAGGDAATLARIDFNSVSPQGAAPGFVYSIHSQEISGVLAHQEASGAELRLLHTADYRIMHVCSQTATGRIAMGIQHRDGSTLGVMNANGAGLAEVTQGESADESPSWAGSGENKLVYQSAGLAHNENGMIVGKAPYAIHLLDLDTAKIDTLLESPQHDLLAPRLAAQGTLYFIRRPYSARRGSRGFFGLLEDIVLFPYRLLYAIFQFLNFFTMRYTGKPLSPSGPMMQKEADPRQMTLWGNVVEARKGLLGDSKEGPALVPTSWELCRKAPGKEVEVLAKSVLSFDLDAQGGLLFTNGYSIFHLSADGSKKRVHKSSFIQQVVVLGEAAGREQAAELQEISDRA
jgi:hypothetical protein